MATTNIELDIENITGVADANDQFIVSAQKFVVSSIPKDLLKFAQTASSSSSDGSAISYTRNDSIIDVQRNGYSCKEIPFSESIWSTTTGSLKKATSSFPVYWHQNDGVKISPATDGSNAGYIFYVSSSKIDDDSDLRNAVVFHATSSEFTKLGSAELPSISITTVPPDSPSLEASPSISDLTISASAPTAPSSPTISSSGVAAITIDSLPSAPDYVTPTQTISGVNWATEYPTGEIDVKSGLASIVVNVDLANSVLDVIPVPPDSPILSSGTYVTLTGTPPTYTKPTITSQTAFSGYTSGLSETDPGVFSITSVPPDTTTVPNFTFSVGTSLPTYTSPTVGGISESLTTTMDADSSGYGTDLDFLNFSKWFSVAGEFIEDEEDSELAAVQLNKISTYISAYSQSMQDKLNIFNTDLQKYQAELQKELQEAQYEQQAEHQSSLQQYQAEVGAYSADVNKEVQEYQQKLSLYSNELNTAFQAWSKTESDNISVFQADISNELNNFNDANIEFQSKLQKDLKDADFDNEEDARLLQKYQAELGVYQGEVAAMSAQSQGYLQTAQGYSAEIQSKMQVTSTKIQEYSSKVQDSLNVFNEGNAVYQASIQRSIEQAQINMQDAQKEADLTLQADIQDYTLELQLFQQKIASYQSVVNDEVQEYQANFQKELQLWQIGRQSDIQKYSAEVQSYNSEVQTQVQEYQNKIQKQQAYAVESKKYYDWSQIEISNYIKNNSKIIGLSIASQSQQQAK